MTTSFSMLGSTSVSWRSGGTLPSPGGADSAGATTQVTIKQDVHQFKSGVNYRF